MTQTNPPRLYSLASTTGRDANKERTTALWGLWTISLRDYLAMTFALAASALTLALTLAPLGSAAWALAALTLPLYYFLITWRSKDNLNQNIYQLARAKYDNKQQGKITLDGKNCTTTPHITLITHSTLRSHTPELANHHYIHDNHRNPHHHYIERHQL